MELQKFPTEDLLGILEAARWAPSANNLQPWRLIAGKRDDSNFTSLFECLVPFNQSWSKRAAAFIAIAGTPTQARWHCDSNFYV
jgi:nitroreductase